MDKIEECNGVLGRLEGQSGGRGTMGDSILLDCIEYEVIGLGIKGGRNWYGCVLFLYGNTL